MTQDEIIEMARQAGDVLTDSRGRMDFCFDNYGLEAFANLVAKHTLMNIDPSKFMSHQEVMEAARMAEREACAKLVESIEAQCIAKDTDDPPLQHIASAVRARGEQA